MNIEDLKIIEHLAGSKSFKETATAFYLSPSTLTWRIKKAETELGTILFERNTKGASLSPEGEIFLEFARTTSKKYEELTQEFKDPHALIKGNIKLYCSVTASTSILPKILKKIKKAHPKITITLETGAPSKGTEKLLTSATDFAIIPLSTDLPAELTQKPIAKIPLVLLKKKKINPPSNLENANWILPKEGQTRTEIDHWFLKNKLTPKSIQTTQEFEAAITLAATGYGITIVPEIVYKETSLKAMLELIPQSLPTLQIILATKTKSLTLSRNKSLWNLI